MKKFPLLALVLVPLLQMGCDGTGPGNGDPNDPDPNDPDPTCTSECTDPDPVELTATATLPDSVSTPGDFVVNDQVACANDTSCMISVAEPTEVCFEFECPTHACVPITLQVTEGDPNPTGSFEVCGNSPNGVYEGADSGTVYTISTEILENFGVIVLSGLPISNATINGNEFQTEMVDGTQNYLDGTISDDLSVIHLRLYENGELGFEEDLIFLRD